MSLDNLFERFVIAHERIADALHALGMPADQRAPLPPDRLQADAEAQKRTRRTKEQMAADTAAQVSKTPATARPIDPVTVPAQPLTSVEDLRKSVIALATEGGAPGKAEMINILSKFGVKKATEAPAEKWAEIKNLADAALATLKSGEEFA